MTAVAALLTLLAVLVAVAYALYLIDVWMRNRP